MLQTEEGQKCDVRTELYSTMTRLKPHYHISTNQLNVFYQFIFSVIPVIVFKNLQTSRVLFNLDHCDWHTASLEFQMRSIRFFKFQANSNIFSPSSYHFVEKKSNNLLVCPHLDMLNKFRIGIEVDFLIMLE